ncbi:NUC169 domain-containing protein [Cladochytrium replicatum]|nr:NUC169 domain-containing protein [Cladochytrium replicatum]
MQRPEIDPIYDSDTSDEETENTIGNVPIEWYDDLPHIGYDIHGKMIMKPAQGDKLDSLLAKLDDPTLLRSVYDKRTGTTVALSKDELELLKRIQDQKFGLDMDPYAPTIEWFTSKTSVTPLSAAPEPKRRFVASKWEAKKIMKIVRAIRAGRLRPRLDDAQTPALYDIWSGEGDTAGEDKRFRHLPATKMPLPDHYASYNPPAEYLMSEEEKKGWNEAHPEDRERNFIPQKYSSLRKVPAYNRFIQERFERCLDLYLCPRVQAKKIHTDVEKLLPKLPDPNELRPFPQREAVVYLGHTGRVRSISVHPNGQWLASGSEDSTVRIWEVLTGRCLERLELGSKAVMQVAWSPNKDHALLAVASGETLFLCSPKIGNSSIRRATEEFVRAIPSASERVSACEWVSVEQSGKQKTVELMKIAHEKPITHISWHRRGDYLVTVSPEAGQGAVKIHQISKRQSQSPFRKSKGMVQCVLFHPSKPFLFVATQRYVLVYNLLKQELAKTLITGMKWISSIDVHPEGDNVIVGSYDRRLAWFDLDLSTKPFKTLRYHKEAIRSVRFHKRYPLFASVGDDGDVNVFHGMVYNDLMRQPLIVPVKRIHGHSVVDSLGALQCEFHPTQPWLISSGADTTIKLYT